MPPVAVLIVAMAVPISAAGVEIADHQARRDIDSAAIGAATAMGTAMISTATTVSGVSRRRDSGKRNARGERDSKDSLHDNLSEQRSGPGPP
jgi:hypothetical protein